MSIKYVILGYLSWQPMTGYDIKRIIADSETLPWTANNNQIYRALVTLHEDEWVSKTVEDQSGAPNRHVYTITDAGATALKAWVSSVPEAAQVKTPFLNQLLWADCLEAAELDTQLEAYLNVVGEKLFFLRVQADQRPHTPDRSEREAQLWAMIRKNWIAHHELELNWIRSLRQELQEMEQKQQKTLARQAQS